MTGGRCEEAGCGRFVRFGARRCRHHAGLDGLAVAAVADGGEEDGDDALRDLFQRRLAAGGYRGLYGPELAAVLAQAGAEPGLGDEIGALRVTLARLLVEERDPARLAAAVARVAGVAVQAARERRALGADQPERGPALWARLLAELDQDQDQDQDGFLTPSARDEAPTPTA